MIQKTIRFFFIFGIQMVSPFFVLGAANAEDNYISSKFPKVFAQHQIIEEGDKLVERGLFEAALNKYREALSPEFIDEENDKGSAISHMTRVLLLLERYDEALKEWQWYIEQSEVNGARGGLANNGEAEFKEQKILALKKFKESGNTQFVRDYIEVYMKRYTKLLPPNFDWGAGPVEIATIIRLYDTIGAYDEGIKFIDEIREYIKKNQVRFGEKEYLYNTITTAMAATECAELDKKMRDRNPDWRTCNLIREHLLIREAFEQDKADGFKGCAGSPPGQPCIGKATKALIQSDYFPW